MAAFFENTYLLAQLFGFCAMTCSVIAWQLKNPRHILMVYVPGSLFWCVQYFLLGAYIGVAIALLSSIKDFILTFIQKQHVPKVIGVYVMIAILIILVKAQMIIDVLPILAILSLNIPMLKRDNRSFIARGCLVSQGCWLVYNFHYGAWMGVLCSVLLTISCLIGMARYEKWEIGRCYRTFLPSIRTALFNLTPRTYP